MMCLLLLLCALKDSFNGCGLVVDWIPLESLLAALSTKLVLTAFEDGGEPLLTVYPFRQHDLE